MIRGALAALVLAALSACYRPNLRPIPEGAQLLTRQESIDWLISLRQKSQEISSYKVLTRTHIEHGDDRDSLRHIFVFSPDGFRVEFLPLNAAYTMALLAGHGDQVVFLNPGDKAVTRSDSAAAAIDKVLHIPADADDLMSLLTGRIPLKYLSNDNAKVYRLPAGGGFQLLAGDLFAQTDEQSNLTRLELDSHFNQKLLLKVAYSDLSEIDGIALPLHIEAVLARYDVTADFKLSKPTLNKPVDAQLFTPPVPADFHEKQDF